MSADRISTSGQIVLQSETLENNSASGDGTTRIFTGARALILSQRTIESVGGATLLKVESVGDGNYRLTSRYTWDLTKGGNSQPPINSHELENNMSQVDVWTNPILRATFVAAFGSQAAMGAAIGFVARLVDKFIQAGDGSAAGQAAAEADITTVYAGAEQALMLDAFRGVAYHQVKNCIQFDTVYRRRITAATYNQIQASFTGAGQIWTTAEVVAFENTPSAWWFQLPANSLWLKAKPVVVTVAQQKTEISYNYLEVAEAWGLLYEAYDSATLLGF
jgi:hypothetical protein